MQWDVDDGNTEMVIEPDCDVQWHVDDGNTEMVIESDCDVQWHVDDGNTEMVIESDCDVQWDRVFMYFFFCFVFQRRQTCTVNAIPAADGAYCCLGHIHL